jgi:hypothetical protein
MEQKFKLLPPPRLISHRESVRVIEAGLREPQSLRPHEAVEEWEPFDCKAGEPGFTKEFIRKAQEVALADKRVRRLLADKRHVAIGASLRDASDDSKGERKSVLFVFYDYADNVVVEVTLDRSADRVTGVRTDYYQPQPNRQEIEEALGLVQHDQRLAEKLTEDLEGFAIVVSTVDPEHPSYHHRLLDVRFLCPADRMPRYLALVDLSTQTVLRAGAGCPGELQA